MSTWDTPFDPGMIGQNEMFVYCPKEFSNELMKTLDEFYESPLEAPSKSSIRSFLSAVTK